MFQVQIILLKEKGYNDIITGECCQYDKCGTELQLKHTSIRVRKRHSHNKAQIPVAVPKRQKRRLKIQKWPLFSNSSKRSSWSYPSSSSASESPEMKI